MGTWLRVRGQVPIHITPQAWETFSTEHRWMLNRYIKEDFDFVFEKIKAVIRESFDKFAFGPDTGCVLTYNRISDYSYNCGEWSWDLYDERYDYSDVLLCFNAWDRHAQVQEGLQILHLAQRKLFDMGIFMPLTWWDSDRLFANTFVHTIAHTSYPSKKSVSSKSSTFQTHDPTITRSPISSKIAFSPVTF